MKFAILATLVAAAQAQWVAPHAVPVARTVSQSDTSSPAHRSLATLPPDPTCSPPGPTSQLPTPSRRHLLSTPVLSPLSSGLTTLTGKRQTTPELQCNHVITTNTKTEGAVINRARTNTLPAR